jgi:hypothetical protein
MDDKSLIRQFFSEATIINHFISIVGLGCLLIWFFETKDILYLTTNGISTNATIDYVDEATSATSNTSDIYYHFKFFSQDTILNSDGTMFFVPKMHWGRLLHLKGEKLEEGSSIQILYDPQDFDKYIFDLPRSKHLSQFRVWGLFLMASAMFSYGWLNIIWKIRTKRL